jgi:hypothetical protein
VQLKLPKARAAALIESVADVAAAASVTPDRVISGADTEQQAAFAAQASESESSSVDRECSRRSSGGERHTRQGDHRCRHRAAKTPSSEWPVPPKLPRAKAAALIESVADAAAAASVTPDRAISGAHAEQRAGCAAQASESVSSSVDREWCRSSCGGERHTHRGDQRCKTPSSKRPVPPKLPKARAAALIESVADVAAAASITPDRAISGADTVQQAARAAQASESESSSVDRERCRRSCGGERHSRQGDQRCRHRAASGLCSSSFREREQQR